MATKGRASALHPKQQTWSPGDVVHQPPPSPKTSMPNGRKYTIEAKPAWLKEWTISRGWIHNRSLEVREEVDSDSSVSNVDDLISVVSLEEPHRDISVIYQQTCENYRENFHTHSLNLELPQEFKHQGVLKNFWNTLIKPLNIRHPSFHNPHSRSHLGRDIALHNTLNARSNIHEDPIPECSDENSLSYIYYNPAYIGSKGSHQMPYQTKTTNKYVIRHVRFGIMLSLRIGQKVGGKRKRGEELRRSIWRMHDEQRRIGNGRTSIKIQNMRHGRLNVLRWLLWEAESREGSTIGSCAGATMPALEKGGTTNGESHALPSGNATLALHYAAARGCLDCVRLLVDSSTELNANTQMDNDVTPVYLAAQEGHLEVLKFLVLEAGGSLYVRAKDGMAPIHAASQMGCLNCVKWMIQDQGVDPNLRDGDGATPLHFAASRGHLETVRWLLKHGARLSLDKYGKSPINDAAENQQVECLNVLVQHGTTPDYDDKSCSCARKVKRNGSDCSTCKPNSEPFYLHPPLSGRRIEPPHAPENGLYVNPMTNHRHSGSTCSDTSSGSESFYLHNPNEAKEVVYNRVKGLFDGGEQRRMSGLKVQVEVHSSSSGAGSDENLSSSDLSSVKSNENDYEDIYLVREEARKQNRSRSRDSGSHSRSGSVSSSNSNVVVENKFVPQKKEEVKVQPPPPPPPPPNPVKVVIDPNDPHLSEPRGAEVVEVVEEPTLRPSDILKGMCRSMSALSARRLNSSCSDLTIVSLQDEERQTAPSSRQRVLPFVPPSFSSTDPNKLIKPSEYLKSISVEKPHEEDVKEEVMSFGPPPPPLPEFNGDLSKNATSKQSTLTHQEKQKHQPLSAISIQDLNSVQLRRTEKVAASKTFSAPTRSVSLQCLNTADAFMTQKIDLIAELKMSKDLTGLKKIKMEKAKTEQTMEKEVISEISKQYTATNFVEKIPDKDNSGNLIPAWKRQMLAKKAADKAKKEMEEQLQKEAEERRLQSIPQWKRQLLAKKEESEIKIRQTIYTPRVVEEPKVRQQQPSEDKMDLNNNSELNNYNPHGSEHSLDEEPSDEEPNIIPWRAQLRKTNSSLNLLF